MSTSQPLCTLCQAACATGPVPLVSIDNHIAGTKGYDICDEVVGAAGLKSRLDEAVLTSCCGISADT